jgi:hypothetical protein
MNDLTLTLKIENRNPVELGDLTAGLYALADEYRRFLPRHVPSRHGADADCRLYVKAVRGGSIEIDLVALAPWALPFMENANTVLDFYGYLRDGLFWLAGRDVAPPSPALERPNLENLGKLVAVTAKDRASQLIIINQENHFHLTATDARAVRDGAEEAIGQLRIPVAGLREQVVLYWYQARNTAGTAPGDRAIIESVARHPVKTAFRAEALKARMLFKEENPFRRAYVVDVMVESVQDKPVLYTILACHDVIDLPTGE